MGGLEHVQRNRPPVSVFDTAESHDASCTARRLGSWRGVGGK